MSSITTDQIVENLYKNAIRFLNFTIDEVLKDKEEGIAKESIIKTSVFLQTTVELALKFSVAFHNGIRSILLEKKQKESTDEKICEYYLDNNLKVEAFEALKNLVRTKSGYLFAKKDEIQKMEKFQNIRNRILHSDYNFSDNELSELQSEFIYIVIHIVIPLLYEPYDEESLRFVSPVDFLTFQLGENKFRLLTNQPDYVKAMKLLADKFARNNDDTVTQCIFCHHLTWLSKSQRCLLCNINITSYDLLDCPECGKIKTVNYDEANIEINDNSVSAICQYCNERLFAKKCLECGNTEAFSEWLFSKEMTCECINLSKFECFPSTFGWISSSFVMSEYINKGKITKLNSKKNMIRMTGDLVVREYLKYKGEPERFRRAIQFAIEELISSKLIKLNVPINDFINECFTFISNYYSKGTEAEARNAFKALDISMYGFDSSEKLTAILNKVINNKHDASILTDEDKDIVTQVKESLSLEMRSFFGINEDLTRPIQEVFQYSNDKLFT